MTIRERMMCCLMDRFVNTVGNGRPVYDDNDELLEYAPANYVVGFGSIDGRRVTVGGEDFTLKDGSPNAAGLRKVCMPNIWLFSIDPLGSDARRRWWQRQRRR